MASKRTYRKQQRRENHLLYECGNGIASTKGYPKPTGKKFVQHIAPAPPPAFGLRALADQMYREDHAG